MGRTFLEYCRASRIAIALVGLLGIVGMSSERALAQVHLTKHNLSNTRRAPDAQPASVTEICVFCHTPFGAEGSVAVPLWNRDLATNSYVTYNSLGTSSLDGATAPVGSVSIACLSCHDGVQALNLMINMPGATPTDALAGPAGEAGRTRAHIPPGEDARRDHPVGNPYAGGPSLTGGPPAAPALYRNTQMKDPDFGSAQSALLNGQSVWWVDTGVGTEGVREKSDIQLYTRVVVPLPGAPADMSTERPEPFIECASCHDPHSAVNGLFLRIVNTGSAVCLACHNRK